MWARYCEMHGGYTGDAGGMHLPCRQVLLGMVMAARLCLSASALLHAIKARDAGQSTGGARRLQGDIGEI